MGKAGLILCWGSALVWALICLMDQIVHTSGIDRNHHAVMAAVWAVGALVLSEMAKWRKL